MKIRKKSNVINSVNQQTFKLKKREIGAHFLITTLNANSLNSSIKTQSG
jgi:hypothetical protein